MRHNLWLISLSRTISKLNCLIDHDDGQTWPSSSDDEVVLKLTEIEKQKPNLPREFEELEQSWMKWKTSNENGREWWSLTIGQFMNFSEIISLLFEFRREKRSFKAHSSTSIHHRMNRGTLRSDQKKQLIEYDMFTRRRRRRFQGVNLIFFVCVNCWLESKLKRER